MDCPMQVHHGAYVVQIYETGIFAFQWYVVSQVFVLLKFDISGPVPNLKKFFSGNNN